MDHPFARVWGVEDLSSGEESDSESPPIGS